MPVSFTHLVDKLYHTSSEQDKKDVSVELSSFIFNQDEDGRGLYLVRQLVLPVLNHIDELFSQRPTLHEDFKRVKLSSIQPSPAVYGVSIGLSFVQKDYLNPEPNLDNFFIYEILSEIKKYNLDIIVKSVTVNTTQIKTEEESSLL